jgi:hypothetical protein
MNDSSRPALLDAVRELARAGPVRVTVRGSCMAPVHGDGEQVEVVPARFYWPGDVVAFAGPDGRLRLHRLLGFRPALDGPLRAVTRGDGCPDPDPPVPLSRLVGRVPGPVPLALRLRSAASLVPILLRAAGRRLDRRFGRLLGRA